MNMVLNERLFPPAADDRPPVPQLPPDSGEISDCAAPVLAICGYSGAGKTTLIEAALHEFRRRNLAVAVVKHDAHGFTVDRPGKDSDRFFQAGATVALRGANEQFMRRGAAHALSLDAVVADFSRDHDLVLVEGHKATPLAKLWLASEHDAAVPPGVIDVRAVLQRDGNRLGAFFAFMDNWLPPAWARRPVFAARFGATNSDSELIVSPGLAPHCSGTEAAGEFRLPIAPDLVGPAAPLLTAHRWAPRATWIVHAAGVGISALARSWLEAQRRPGVWAIQPRRANNNLSSALALCEPQALALLEREPAWRLEGISALRRHLRTISPPLPAELAAEFDPG